eukprot:TRINITY_DN6028_c0_g4_i3.p1 TRINITY_DN6028_c0_g4~~TRINITY_DN6028_c0_g4_i3.p1  ORF type:complete len:356 (+),score=54.10 TRINITY_DN6028_c0_g4_i3:200-1267(+)
MLEQSAVKDWKGKALLAAHLLVVVFAIVGICGVYGTGVHWSSATVSGIQAANSASDQEIKCWFGLLKFGPDKDSLPDNSGASDNEKVRRFVRRSLEHPSLRRSELASLQEELAQIPNPGCAQSESEECTYSEIHGYLSEAVPLIKANVTATVAMLQSQSLPPSTIAILQQLVDQLFTVGDNVVTLCSKCDHYGKASLAFLVITLVVALAGIALLLVPEDKIPGRSELVYNISLGVLLVSCSLALLLWLGCSSSITTTTSSLQDVVKLVTEGLNAAGLQEMAAMYSSLTFSSSTSSGFYCTLVAMIAVLCAAALQLISVIRSSRLTGQYDSMGRDDDVEVNSSMVITGVAVKSGMA